MERKLVKQGRNALTVTLPAAWTQHHHLKAGDTVSISAIANNLLIEADTRVASTEITINAAGTELTMLRHLIAGAYVRGYDRIIILNGELQEIQVNAERLIGFVIEEQTPTRTVLKSIIAPSGEDTLTLIRRAGHILQQHANILLGIAEGTATQTQLEQNERLLNNTLFFCLRHLNTYEKGGNAFKYFLLCTTMESAGDQIEVLGRHIGKQRALAQLVVKALEDYNKYLFANDFKQFYRSMRQFRHTIPQKTYAEGIATMIAYNLFNNVGYLVEEKHQNI
jgi:phosphate uptake regulator